LDFHLLCFFHQVKWFSEFQLFPEKISYHLFAKKKKYLWKLSLKSRLHYSPKVLLVMRTRPVTPLAEIKEKILKQNVNWVKLLTQSNYSVKMWIEKSSKIVSWINFTIDAHIFSLKEFKTFFSDNFVLMTFPIRVKYKESRVLNNSPDVEYYKSYFQIKEQSCFDKNLNMSNHRFFLILIFSLI
jgi:hypothetical protein